MSFPTSINYMSEDTRAVELSKRIPREFTLGVATASWQIEGDSQGRGRSIWDDFADIPGNIKDGTKADPACDHVNRLDQDLDILANLGVDAYRFSVSWPRVIPGHKKPSASGIDFYSRLIDGLLERNIRPALTMYHWDLPSELEEKGGWLNRDIHNYFAEYADTLATHFGDRVAMWATLNEPWVSAFLGYATKMHAPGLGNPAAGLEAGYRLMTAHGAAMSVLREHKVSQPGTVLNLTQVIAEDAAAADAAEHLDSLHNKFWLDLLAGRGIDSSLVERTAALTDWSFVDESQLASISQPIDWLGINYYTPIRVAGTGAGTSTEVQGQDFALYPGTPAGATMASREPRTEMGWEIFAPSMTETLKQTAERLPGVPLYITENGGAFDDKLVDGEIHDADRVDYYQNHISAALDAIDQGVDLRGYFAWSMMDNIEWAEGLEKRFGIYYVDPINQERLPKDSAKLIQFLATNR
ncbi:GH1 family beta-glucosidase [Aquiluna sp.]|nr:GH1 family beta-glucosidase [Aquiluna sp.]